MDSEMLGRVISTARKQKNLSQKELGDLLCYFRCGSIVFNFKKFLAKQ